MIDRNDTLPVTRQADLLGVARSTVYYTPEPVSVGDLRRMRRMGIHALYRRPNTSQPADGHPVYPYWLRDLTVDHANPVWATDITYIPMKRGFVYLCAIVDGHSRRVLAWRLSNTLTVDLCTDTLNAAFARYGTPEICNSDQGSQVTSPIFTDILSDHHIRISMDGKGRWRDNVFVERLWRSVQYEEVYLQAYDTLTEARNGLKRYFAVYNTRRPHSSLDRKTPDAVYFTSLPLPEAA